MAGRFEIPGFYRLGEALLLNGSGGIVGRAGPFRRRDERRFPAPGRGVLQGGVPRRGMTAGAALLAAMKSYLQLGGRPYLLNIYNWLGDPALAFK